jgi:hypothetical protein
MDAIFSTIISMSTSFIDSSTVMISSYIQVHGQISWVGDQTYNEIISLAKSQ